MLERVSQVTPRELPDTPKKRHGSQVKLTLDVLRPVNREGSHQGEIKCIPTTNKNSDSLLSRHVPPLRTEEMWGKMKLNEPGETGENGVIYQSIFFIICSHIVGHLFYRILSAHRPF